MEQHFIPEGKGGGILIASPMSGSGKTTVTVGILGALRSRGIPVNSFKCGPDYIDPMYHTQVLGVPCRNLDTWFTGEKKTRELFFREQPGPGTIRIAEGVMGLYDGVAGTEKEGSSYDLARVLGLPILLVVSCRGMGRSVLPLLRGMLSEDRENLIRGFFLVQISEAMYDRLKPAIEEETGIPCLGFLPFRKELVVSSRHLGLVTPDEKTNDFPGDAAKCMEKAMDWERFFRIAASFSPPAKEQFIPEASIPEEPSVSGTSIPEKPFITEPEKTPPADAPVLAVARDEAFSFLYEDNLWELTRAGIKLVFFSPLHDPALPEGADGLLLPGGYPELYAGKLSENRSMRESIRQAALSGLPLVAECGGFLYLQQSLTDPEGRTWPMAGVLPGTSRNAGRSVRFGYVEIREEQPRFLPEGIRLRGHEFHYYDSTDPGQDCRMEKPVTGKCWQGIHTSEIMWAGFPHLYYPAEPEFVRAFAEKMNRFHRDRKRKALFFENRDCPYYPCHQGIDRINCLFCYCPMYTFPDCPGNPEWKEKDGKKRKSCAGCTFPHREENAEDVLRILRERLF